MSGSHLMAPTRIPMPESFGDDLCRRFSAGPCSLRTAVRRLTIRQKKLARRVVLSSGWVIKRSIDIVTAGLGLILLAPLLVLVAAMIKLTDGGPVLFWQKRIGRWGQEFWFPKLRSMVVDAERLKASLLEANDHGNCVTFKMKRDPRITWIGRFIRKLSIDELPQLWCVLIGTMTLVGPRPPVAREVALYTLADRRRLDAVPGLTCLWQIRGRGDLPFPEQVRLDREYIEHQTIWLDIQILFLTVPAVLLGKGAY